jgi:predicted esterase
MGNPHVRFCGGADLATRRPTRSRVKYPELWAALAPVAPAFYSSPDELVKIKNTPVIVVQGDADPFVNVDMTRQFVEKMKSLGMRYVYIEVPGGDHMTVITQQSREHDEDLRLL